MAILKCKMCGGDLDVVEDTKIIECEYCGTKQTVPDVNNEKKLNLFNRANRLRMVGEFDKAEAIYENIIAEFPEEAEAYWGLCLCNYGIEYVDDPTTAKKIPTCHRTSFNSIQKDEKFELALEYADVVAQKIYRDEAREIDRLMNEILAISANEKPYDVFICYKETDDKGGRTVDSVMAQDIYDALTAKGLKVFFARITLEDKLGRQYEPYIFGALNSAKVMLSIGTKYEYFHAIWVKNEWSRFLKLMVKDKSKVLIPCYKDIDAYDMPEEFKQLQAQDIGKIGAIQDLVRGIEKLVVPENVSNMQGIQQNTVQITGPNVDALMKRGYMALEDSEWNKAKKYFDQVLNVNAECAEAYLGLAMADGLCSTKKALVYTEGHKNKNYQRAKQFADENLLQELNEYEEKLKSINKEKKEKENKQREEERKQREVSRVTCEKKRKEIALVQNLVHTYYKRTYALQSNGTVLAVGDNSDGQCDVMQWRDIVAISSSYKHTVGLTTDGTVLAVGDNDDGQCNVTRWKNIVAISAGFSHTVGLKSDGTVVAVGCNVWGECNVMQWKDIAVICANNCSHTVGLKVDGAVVAVGCNNFKQCNVESWRDIVAISIAGNHTVGLKADGTVVAVGVNNYGQCNVDSWKDIIEIGTCITSTVGLRADGTVVSTNYKIRDDVKLWKDIVSVSVANDHTVGLQADGTVVAVGNNNDGQCDVTRWRDIVAISAEEGHTVGLKKDGTVVAVGNNSADNCEVSSWKLFNNFETYEQELEDFKREESKRKAKEEVERKAREEEAKKQQEALEKKRSEYRSQGVCQYCGGAFKGLFSKKCSNCGKEKDY